MRLLLVALLWMSAAGLQAGDRIWSALVLATNEHPPRPVPSNLEAFEPTIRKVFGYNSLYLLGEKKRDLVSGAEEWLVPSRAFFFKVQVLGKKPTCYELQIELYRGQKLLVTSHTRLARDAPLYIRGPQWGGGQLVLLLEVR
jgi:hypothetical protein